MAPRSYRMIYWLIVFVVAFGCVIQPSSAAQSDTIRSSFTPNVNGSTATSDSALFPPRTTLSAPPSVVDRQIPMLNLDVRVSPDPLRVGESATITVTVTNAAADPAEDVVVTLAVPDGSTAQPDSNLVSPAAGWRWNIGRMNAQEARTCAASVQVTHVAPSATLFTQAKATARGLDAPVIQSGGALLLDEQASAGTSAAPETSATASTSQPAALHAQAVDSQTRQPVTLRMRAVSTHRTATGEAPLSDIPGFYRGLGAFVLEAPAGQSVAAAQANTPQTIRVPYTSEQLDVRRIPERHLTLFRYDEAAQDWVALPTEIDASVQVAIAQVNGIAGEFQLGNGASPSQTFIPSTEGWQVSLFTGAATINYPLDVPATANGMKPDLSLNYSSAETDGDAYKLALKQAGWVGKGWNLGASYIALNKTAAKDNDYYSLVLNGESYTLVRGAPLAGTPSPNVIQGWNWHATDERFLRIRATSNDSWSVWTKAGVRYDFNTTAKWGWNKGDSGNEFETYKWMLSRVQDTHGNQIKYEYQTQSLNIKGVTVHPDIWPVRILWGSNANIPGSVDRFQVAFLSNPRGTGPEQDMDWDYSEKQSGDKEGAPHETRRLDSVQVLALQPDNQWKLLRQYNFAYDFSLFSDADDCDNTKHLCNETDNHHTPKITHRKLTLKTITMLGSDGKARRVASNGSLLPDMTFSYYNFYNGNLDDANDDRGRNKQAKGGWNRLKTATNELGGGSITFTYHNIAQVVRSKNLLPPYHNVFFNRHRVVAKTLADGLGHSYTTTYDYRDPSDPNRDTAAVNSLGTRLGGAGSNSEPNSATLFNASKNNALNKLAIRNQTEFRGHAHVAERFYNSTMTNTAPLHTIRHWFIQGDIRPGVDPACQLQDINTSCFEQLRDREFSKGREWKTAWQRGDGTTLRETQRVFSAKFYAGSVHKPGGTPPYENYPQRGLWRAFSFEQQTQELFYEGTTTPLVKTIKNHYDFMPNQNRNSNDKEYGNLTATEEFDTSNTRLRVSGYHYAVRDDDAAYMVKMGHEDTYDGSMRIFSSSTYYYDAIDPVRFYKGQQLFKDKGELTRVSRYINNPLVAVEGLVEVPIATNDTTYEYDAYGNRKKVVTYAGAGTATLHKDSAGYWRSYSAPGNSSAQRVTEYAYDDPSTGVLDESYRGLPTQVTYPVVPSSNNIRLVQKGAYDFMGNLISVTDFNNHTSRAGYDAFGRMNKLIKPGDSDQHPTLQAFYDDAARPLRYTVNLLETRGQTATRPVQRFYDGLGREVQTKQESKDGAQNIIVDKRYDALGRVVEESQPRYADEPNAADPNSLFWKFIKPADDQRLYRSTRTTYDALDRPLVIEMPDNEKIVHHYGIGGGLRYDDVIDQNRHRTQWHSDVFGRIAQVVEIKGACSPQEPPTYWTEYQCPQANDPNRWETYATTSYEYSPLDLLTKVTDAHGNTTSMAYDSLGRKTTMTDPDMGKWSYAYDANGNLQSQTDAMNQTIRFDYDTLDRLLRKRVGDTGNITIAAYTYDETTPLKNLARNGLGQRTGMSRLDLNGAQVAWTFFGYNERGQKALAEHHLANVSGDRTFRWEYDSADRLAAVIYPNGEKVASQYDEAWRPKSLASDQAGALVSAATYTALDQPAQRQFGNNLFQTWSYDSLDPRKPNVMQRLMGIQVGSAGTPGNLFDTRYTYDNVGNVQTITDRRWNQSYTYGYDHRDRLTSIATSASGTATSSAPAGQELPRTAWEAVQNGAPASETEAAPEAQAQVAATPAPFQEQNGQVVAEAENAHGNVARNTQTWAARTDVAGFAGSGFMRAEPDAGTTIDDSTYAGKMPELQYQVQVNTPGTYHVWARMYAGDSGSDTVHVGLDGQAVASASQLVVQTTGAWTWSKNRRDGSVATLNISSAGLHTINLWMREDGARVDRLLLTRDSNDTPSGAGPAESPRAGTPPSGAAPVKPPVINESYGYDKIGNLLNKGGNTFTYGIQSQAMSHKLSAAYGRDYDYDKNGNLTQWRPSTTKGGEWRSFTWDVENQLIGVKNAHTGAGAPPPPIDESYAYDADGSRVLRTSAGKTTLYLEGLWEEPLGGAAKVYYLFNGQPVALREGAGAPVYLHGDHLGSVSLATSASGQFLSQQHFDPWGQVRAGKVDQTSLNYTGQRLDDSGLLYYNARYYDPTIGRFMSADTVVPGNASGSMDGVALAPLTVDFHEPGLLTSLNSEADNDELYRGGPKNPQALNRYSYVLNNPLLWTDPSGHERRIISAREFTIPSDRFISYLDNLDREEGLQGKIADFFSIGISTAAGGVIAKSGTPGVPPTPTQVAERMGGGLGTGVLEPFAGEVIGFGKDKLLASLYQETTNNLSEAMNAVLASGGTGSVQISIIEFAGLSGGNLVTITALDRDGNIISSYKSRPWGVVPHSLLGAAKNTDLNIRRGISKPRISGPR